MLEAAMYQETDSLLLSDAWLDSGISAHEPQPARPGLTQLQHWEHACVYVLAIRDNVEYTYD